MKQKEKEIKPRPNIYNNQKKKNQTRRASVVYYIFRQSFLILSV